MKTIFLVLASVITVCGIIPYALDIIRGSTTPNIVSWITWTLLTLVATIAEVAAHEYITAIFTSAAVLETLIIVLLGIRYGYVKYTRFDVVCQISALFGFLLWYLFNSPAIAVIASVTIDFIGALPTIRHSWITPHEETWSAYAFSGIGGLFALLALTSYNWTSLTYAIYIVGINIIMTSILIYRQNIIDKKIA